MSLREIGCCGAYCQTCRALTGSACRGCKLGYENGQRDIDRSRCKIKLCCFRDREFETCAECPDFSACTLIRGLYEKSGYKYGKYKQSIMFIRDKGYADFLRFADTWKGPYGKLG